MQASAVPTKATTTALQTPVNDITRLNYYALHTQIFQLIEQADFIGIDTELTGIHGKDSHNTNIADRYKGLVNVVKTHALVSLGMSLFVGSDVGNVPRKVGEGNVGGVGTKEADDGKELEDANNHRSTPRDENINDDIEQQDNAQLEKEDGECTDNELDHHDVYQHQTHYKVHNLNWTLMSQYIFSMSPSAMTFLVTNGFDFNRQALVGVPYWPGNEKTMVIENKRITSQTILREMFKRISQKRIPIIVHNGLIDLMFIYQSFYCDLPDELSSFVSDIVEMFPGGVVDTKYISDYIVREEKSFLAYIFRKCEREQTSRKMNPNSELPYFTISLQQPLQRPEQPSETKRKTPPPLSSDKPFCEKFAAYGSCRFGANCRLSHDLDLILDYEEASKSQRKKMRLEVSQSEQVDISHREERMKSETPITKPIPSHVVQRNGSSEDKSLTERERSVSPVDMGHTIPAPPSPAFLPHTAAFDAYMTAYIFAHHLVLPPSSDSKPTTSQSRSQSLKQRITQFISEYGNKVNLSGKDIPLRLEKSMYSSRSKNWENVLQKWNENPNKSEKVNSNGRSNVFE